MLIKIILIAIFTLIVSFASIEGSPIDQDAIQILEQPEKSEMDKKLYR